jgi:hypothetical protein
MHEETRAKVFEILGSMGVKKVEVEFSGGNDEGGVQDITLHPKAREGISPDNTEMSLSEGYEDLRFIDGQFVKLKSGWQGIRGGYEPTTTTDEDFLRSALGIPVYDKYSTFAGEFYVSGKLIWYVEAMDGREAGSIVIVGQEEVSSWQDISEEID